MMNERERMFREGMGGAPNYPDAEERVRASIEGLDPNTGEIMIEKDPDQTELGLTIPEIPEISAEDKEIFGEVEAGDYTNISRLTKLTPEIAHLLAQSEGSDSRLLEMEPDEGKRREAQSVISGNAVMMRENASEYDTGRILRLDGILVLNDTAVAEALTEFKGTLVLDNLQGGQPEAMATLLKHKGPLIVRSLTALGVRDAALIALAERPYFTPVDNLILTEEIQEIAKLKREGIDLHELVREIEKRHGIAA